jgi:hypothetical protein
MARTPTTAPRWASWAAAAAMAWAMRSAPRWRPTGPGWPPDTAPAAMITSLIAFVAAGTLGAWMLHHGGTTARLRHIRTSAVLFISGLAQLGFAVVWSTASAPADRIGTLVALAAFALGLLVTATRSCGGAVAAQQGHEAD